MKTVKNLIIGFGKGGKTLAGYMASKKESVIIVEESDKMFGGTCINVACIPSKAMEYSGRMVKATTGSFPEQIERYKKAVQEKNNLISLLRQKNYEKAVNAGVEVIVGKASFIDTCHVHVLLKNGVEEVIEAERIFINTGSRPFIPPIKGLKESRYSYLSEDLLSLEKLPSHLVIIGAGYIGMEFASIFRNFGSSVPLFKMERYSFQEKMKKLLHPFLIVLKDVVYKLFKAQPSRL